MEKVTPRPVELTAGRWGWFKEHLLELVALSLLLFIPLYPKFPLFEPITGYIVRVRLEDLLIAAAFVIWAIYLGRGKINLKDHPLTKPVAVYLLVGLLSTLSALFLTRTVPLNRVHVFKLYLHYFRRIEYLFLAFLFFTIVKDLAVVKRATLVLGLTVLGVTIYGFGQKYLLWPVISTMNREFAKGWRLYLTEHARVVSTFGGHYDLAAWLVIVLTTFVALALLLRSSLGKLGSLALFIGAYLLLLLTASRASFISYLVAVTLLIAVLVVKKGFWWGLTRWGALAIFSLFFLFTFGDMAERFGHVVGQGRLSDYLQLLLWRYQTPRGDVVVSPEMVASRTDEPPSPFALGELSGRPERPPDVYEDIPAEIKETVVFDEAGQPTIVRRATPREYSPTAVTYGLSSAIRFDVLWPRAWAGFKRNPLLGSGYSTLTKAKIEEFTEAESTDNDYLRNLGETGLLGMLALGWIFWTIGKRIHLGLTRLKDPFLLALTAGLGAATVGLLINALYIDVFEASKVAEPYWAWTGLILGALHLGLPEAEQKQSSRRIRLAELGLAMILALGFLVRLYRLSAPLADWHSWRQADTAAVARIYARDGIDLAHPRYDDLSSIPSGLPNPEGHRFVEFPLQAALIAIAATVAPTWSLLIWGRLLSIGLSTISTLLLFLIVRRHSGRGVAWLTAFFFAFLPFNIYYSRVILPEPVLVSFMLAGLYLFDLYLGGWESRLVSPQAKPRLNRLMALAGSLCLAVALLLKPYVVFFWPALIYFLVQKQASRRLWLVVAVLLGASMLPFLIWRWWAGHFPEGIPAWTWLLNNDGIRLRPAWFRWLFAERLAKLILGYWGVVPFTVGVLRRPKEKEGWYFHLWLAGGLAYLVTFATGNVTHDYYQVILVPVIAIFLGRGTEWFFLARDAGLARGLVWLAVPGITFLSLAFSWYQVRDFFNINRPEIVTAGQAVDTLVHGQAKVIAPYGGDTAFLYQTRRQGWPIGGEIEEKIKQGAEFYVSVNLDDPEVQDLAQRYTVVEKGEDYVIIQLLAKGWED